MVALVVAIPLGTVRVRGDDVEWLGIRYTLAVVAAVMLGFLFSQLVVWTFLWRDYDLYLVASSALTGAFSGWFAVGARRWAEGGRVEPGTERSRWDPRSWGAAGTLGTALILPAAVVCAAISAQPIPGLGPSWVRIFFVQAAGLVLLALGLVGLTLEAARPYRHIGV